MDIPLGWQLFIQVILIAVNAIFASAEIAIVSMNELKLEKLAEDGNRRAKRLRKLTEKPAGFLATIQIAITLSGFLGSVFGELVPKRVAMKKTQQISLGVSGLIYVSSKFFAPLVWLLTASTNLVLRILRIDPNGDDEEVSEEEIRMLVDVGGQKGIFDKTEQKMIVNVFEFDDKDAGEFSTHRKDIQALDIDDDVTTWEKVISASTHSLYPVFKGSIDNVVAVLDSKKFFRIADKTRAAVKKDAFVQPIYVPETMKIDVLFELMQKSHNHFAVVLDEYGGTVGIITMNDLLEQLVGDLDNDQELPNAQPDVVPLTDRSWKIKGGVSLDDVAELTGLELPVDTYETLSGYIFGLYCTIPKDGSKFDVETEDLEIQVLDVRKHTVASCILTLKEKDEAQPQE